jgi:hypothetical protein
MATAAFTPGHPQDRADAVWANAGLDRTTLQYLRLARSTAAKSRSREAGYARSIAFATTPEDRLEDPGGRLLQPPYPERPRDSKSSGRAEIRLIIMLRVAWGKRWATR